MGGSNTGGSFNLRIHVHVVGWGFRARTTHRCCNQCREPQESHGDLQGRSRGSGQAQSGDVRASTDVLFSFRQQLIDTVPRWLHLKQLNVAVTGARGQLSPDGHQWGWDVRSVNWGWISCTLARRPSSRSSPCRGPQYQAKKWC